MSDNIVVYNFTQRQVELALCTYLSMLGVKVPEGEIEVLGLLGIPHRKPESVVTMRVTPTKK